MSIKEQLQQILADRARQEAEEARRENEARELERVPFLAEEARKNAEIQRVKTIFDSKGISQMLKGDVLPLLREMGAWPSVTSVSMERIFVSKKDELESIDVVGITIGGSGPKRGHNASRYDNYDHARLGIFIETGVGAVHLCAGENNSVRAQFSLNDRNLRDKIESELAKILSEPRAFCWDNPSPESYDTFGPG